jgi:hypothetical protein
MADTFSLWVRSYVADAQNSRCFLCCDPIDDFHHRLPNTVCNRAKYPLFIQSPFNCAGLCRRQHDSSDKYLIRINEAHAEIYELWLRKFKAGTLT